MMILVYALEVILRTSPLKLRAAWLQCHRFRSRSHLRPSLSRLCTENMNMSACRFEGVGNNAAWRAYHRTGHVSRRQSANLSTCIPVQRDLTLLTVSMNTNQVSQQSTSLSTCTPIQSCSALQSAPYGPSSVRNEETPPGQDSKPSQEVTDELLSALIAQVQV